MNDNRTKILHVALRLFAMHGYDAVGVQQIVNEAGVTKPTLYHYFQSKKGLFEALLAEKSADLLVGLKAACSYKGDLVYTISQIAGFYFDFLEQEPTFYRLMLATWFMPPSSGVYVPVARLHQQQHDLVEGMFLAAVADHGNMHGRQQRYAISLRGMIDTYVGLSLQGMILLNDDQIRHRIVHEFMHGIFS